MTAPRHRTGQNWFEALNCALPREQFIRADDEKIRAPDGSWDSLTKSKLVEGLFSWKLLLPLPLSFPRPKKPCLVINKEKPSRFSGEWGHVDDHKKVVGDSLVWMTIDFMRAFHPAISAPCYVVFSPFAPTEESRYSSSKAEWWA